MKLYAKYLSIHFRSQMQYKASFFMTALGQFLVSFTALLSIWFLFDRFHHVEQYSFPEVLICFSVVLTAFSLAECFFRGFDTFPRLIRSGELDRFLVRPRNVVFQVLASNIEFSRLGRLAQAVLMLSIAIPTSGILWTWDKVLTLGAMILGGFAVFSGLFLIYAALSFFIIDGLEFMNIFTDGSREFGMYPLSIYGKEILTIYTWLVPIALFQYYPFLYLTGRSDRLLFLFAPMAGFLFLLPSWAFFRFGLRKYQSTGS